MKKLFILLIFMVSFVLLSTFAKAQTETAVVGGKIYEIGTDPKVGIKGASVFVKCLNNTNTANTASGDNGYYSIIFECPMKGVVEVEATYDSSSGKNSGKVKYSYSLSGGTIDVGLALVDVAIPEFSIITTPIVLSLLSFGIASFVRKKKTSVNI